MSKPITIPIKSHTPVRRPKSKWVVNRGHAKYSVESLETPLVQDIKRVHKASVAGYPEKIIGLFDEAVRHQKGDWNKWHKENGVLSYDEYAELKPEVLKSIKNRNLPKIDPVWLSLSKPSLLTKLKNRFKK